MELLMIAGFIFIVLIVLIYLLFSYFSQQQGELTASQADAIAKQLVESAEKVYYFGEPSKVKVEANMPDGILEMVIRHNDPAATGCIDCTEIRFKVQKGEVTDWVSVSTKINLTTNTTNEFDPNTNPDGIIQGTGTSGNIYYINFSRRMFGQGTKNIMLQARDEPPRVLLLLQ